jgi:hypothetical protein
VAQGVEQGLTSSEIARELKFSENSAKNYKLIVNKLMVSSRVEAVIYGAHHRTASRQRARLMLAGYETDTPREPISQHVFPPNIQL